MQIKNNYNIAWKIENEYGKVIEDGTGIYNGDIGIVKKIDKRAETLTVLFDDMRQAVYEFSACLLYTSVLTAHVLLLQTDVSAVFQGALPSDIFHLKQLQAVF